MKSSIKRHGKFTPRKPADERTRVWAGSFGQVEAAVRLKKYMEQKVALQKARELYDDIVDGMRK